LLLQVDISLSPLKSFCPSCSRCRIALPRQTALSALFYWSEMT